MSIDKIAFSMLIFLTISASGISSAAMIAIKVLLNKYDRPIRATYSYVQSDHYSIWRMIFLFSLSGLSEPFEYTNIIVLSGHTLFMLFCLAGSLGLLLGFL